MKNLITIVLSVILLFSCAEDPLYEGSQNYQQALSLYKAEKYTEAKEILQRIQSSSSDPSELARAYFLLGYIHHKQDSTELAYYNFKEAKTYFLALDDHLYISKSYNRLGRIFYELGSYAKALDYLEQAYDYAKASGNDKQVANDLYAIGRCYSRLGNYEQALVYLFEARALEQSLERLSYFLDIQLEIGIVQRIVGNYDLAIEHYWMTMNAATDTPHESIMKAKCYNNLGYAYYELGEYQKSEQYLEMALTYPDRSDVQIAATFNNLGQVSNKLGNHMKASAYFQKSVALNQSNMDLEEVIFTFNEIRPLPGIKSNADSLAYYMDVFAQITLPIVTARKKLEGMDLRYKLEGLELAENQEVNQKMTIPIWAFLLIVVVALIIVALKLKVRMSLQPRQQGTLDYYAQLRRELIDQRELNAVWMKRIKKEME